MIFQTQRSILNGCLRDAFEAHDKKVELLSSRIVALELELTIVNKKYEDLCGKLRKNANNDRNEEQYDKD